MAKVKHLYLTVTSDDLKKDGGEYENLADFACKKLNEHMDENFPNVSRIISIESEFSVNEVRPVQCNSSTWYQRQNMRLSVWFEDNSLS